MSFIIVNCAFAEDCWCSKKGYVRKGNMENHLQKKHNSALGLTALAPYCPACDKYFASKRVLFNHIMDTHVRARISPPPAHAVSVRSSPTASSLMVHEAAIDGPSNIESPPENRGISLYNMTMVDGEGYADTVHEGRTLDDGTSWTGDSPTSAVSRLKDSTTFLYISPVNEPGYIHPIARRNLPRRPVVLEPHFDFHGHGHADYHRESDQPGRPSHS
jgi:hypothetical protein